MQFHILAILARGEHTQRLQSLVLEGRIQEAAASAEALLGDDAGALSAQAARDIAELGGDLMLALDRAEEAEGLYRQAVRAAGRLEQRGATRLASCRATGLLSLHQRRLGTAASSFSRIAADEQATAGQRIDALCSLAVAQHALGQKQRVQKTLDEASELASQAGAALAMVVSLLRVEILAQREIRAHDDLRDHVFWQAADGAMHAQGEVQPLAAIDACLQSHGHHRFVAERLQHYRDLILSSFGDARTLASLPEHLARLRRAGLATLERAARIETALVAIVVRHSELARAILEPLQGREGEIHRQRWNMETLYCFAKLCTLTGRSDDAMRWYQRYALESMQCVRAEAVAAEPATPGERPAAGARSDELELQLPAKYRRAYRYMIEHLECAELSVREIADNIGVTERALQLTFRAHLGLSPAELMQRCRVERIRADLLREDKTEATVYETAARWGIRNRSTLANSYRKYFRETPTQTLARRGVAAALA